MRNIKKVFWKAIFSLSMIVGLLFSSVSFTTGIEAAGTTLGPSSGYNASFAGSGTAVSAEAGNVTELTISGTKVTTAWAGFFGNITGAITLEDATGNVFYNWSGLGTPAGEVYASNTSVIDWTAIQCANAGNQSLFDGYLGLTGSSPDRVEATYGVPAHVQFSVAGTIINANTCNTTNAYSNSNLNANRWKQLILQDDNERPVFTTLINASETNFRNSVSDFQLLTGVPGTGTVYFFVELN